MAEKLQQAKSKYHFIAMVCTAAKSHIPGAPLLAGFARSGDLPQSSDQIRWRQTKFFPNIAVLSTPYFQAPEL